MDDFDEKIVLVCVDMVVFVCDVVVMWVELEGLFLSGVDCVGWVIEISLLCVICIGKLGFEDLKLVVLLVLVEIVVSVIWLGIGVIFGGG